VNEGFVCVPIVFLQQDKENMLLYHYTGTLNFENSFTLSVMATKKDKVLKEFGQTVKRLRIQKGLSTREFADEAEIAHSSVGRLESGLTDPRLTTVIKIADVLNADLSYFIKGFKI
jgi:DNA-binding XRE family transcriptional regulator